MRNPVIGDFANLYDNATVKNIDILDDDGSVGNTIVATEWFAELCFAGWWRVNPDWLAWWTAQQEAEPDPVPPEEPVPGEMSP
jgi:hypothetical protein